MVLYCIVMLHWPTHFHPGTDVLHCSVHCDQTDSQPWDPGGQTNTVFLLQLEIPSLELNAGPAWEIHIPFLSQKEQSAFFIAKACEP